jgi:L-2-hydroxyglutarate oxidase LhgO
MKFDAVIIGGGVIGISVALEFQKRGLETVLIEKNHLLGDEVSSRNSGVIHSGIYYPNNSLKAQLTFKGNQLLYQYAKDKKVPYKKMGKIIFGFDGDQGRLNKLFENGVRNGVKGLSLVDGDQINTLESNLDNKISCGILSKNTGIIDVPSFIQALADDYEKNGGLISKNSVMIGHKNSKDLHTTTIKTGNEIFEINSHLLILAGGLNSYNIGKLIPGIKNCKQFKKLNFTKGHYYKIFGAKPFNHLIYPLPNTFGLGIHYTLDVSGAVKFGPDNEFIDNLDYSFTNGAREKFVNSIRKYWPSIENYELHEDYVGIRPKIQEKGSKFSDFSILTKKDHGIENMLFLQGIESPGLTCSLSLSEYIAKQLNL